MPDFGTIAKSYHFLVKNKAVYDKLLMMVSQDMLIDPSDKVNTLSGLDSIEQVGEDGRIECMCHQCEGEVVFQLDEDTFQQLSECNSCSLIFLLELSASELVEMKNSLK